MMPYNGEGEGRKLGTFVGESKESLDNAIRAAVRDTDLPEESILVVSHIEVTTVGDPNIGSYKVILSQTH
jgi:flavin-binding protein dodecin